MGFEAAQVDWRAVLEGFVVVAVLTEDWRGVLMALMGLEAAQADWQEMLEGFVVVAVVMEDLEGA